MDLVLDTNVLLSSLIKDSTTRKLIIESGLGFYYPYISFHEIEKYTALVLKKSGMTKKEYDKILKILLDKITFVSKERVFEKLKEANKLIGHIDKDDVVFLACALSLNIPIWSDDKDFKKQEKIRIFTSQEMISMFFKKSFKV